MCLHTRPQCKHWLYVAKVPTRGNPNAEQLSSARRVIKDFSHILRLIYMYMYKQNKAEYLKSLL